MREFASASEMIEHYGAVRDRLRNPPNAVPEPEPVIVAEPEAEAAAPEPEPPPPEPEPEPEPWTPPPMPPREPGAPITANAVMRATARHFEIRKEWLVGRKQTVAAALRRQIAMYLTVRWTGLGFHHVGRIFGGRDHSTVWYAYYKITDAIQTDDAIRSDVQAIESMLGVTAIDVPAFLPVREAGTE